MMNTPKPNAAPSAYPDIVDELGLTVRHRFT